MLRHRVLPARGSALLAGVVLLLGLLLLLLWLLPGRGAGVGQDPVEKPWHDACREVWRKAQGGLRAGPPIGHPSLAHGRRGGQQRAWVHNAWMWCAHGGLSLEQQSNWTSAPDQVPSNGMWCAPEGLGVGARGSGVGQAKPGSSVSSLTATSSRHTAMTGSVSVGMMPARSSWHTAGTAAAAVAVAAAAAAQQGAGGMAEVHLRARPLQHRILVLHR